MNTTTRTLGTKALRGIKWVSLSTVVSKSFQAVVLIVLARVLSPQDFGLVGIALIVTTIVSIFQDLGLSSALIQRKDRTEDAANIIFITSIIFGIFWYVMVYFLAPSAAYFFHNEEITLVLRVMGLSFLIVPFGSVQNALLRREFYFKRIFYLNLIPAVVPGTLSMILAFLGFSYWSLVFANLVSSLLNVVVLWLIVPWKPSFHYELTLTKDLLRFGGTVTFHNIITWILNNFDHILVGKWLGISTLGIYRVGFRIARMPIEYTTANFSKVLYPAFCKIQDQPSQLINLFLKTLKYISLLTIPSGIGIALTANLSVPILLGEKWNSLIPVIQILAVWGTATSLLMIIPIVFRAIGRPDIFLKISIFRLLVSIPILFWAIPKGLAVLCFSQVVIVLAFFIIGLIAALRVLNLSPYVLMRTFRLSTLSSIASGTLLFTILKYSSIHNHTLTIKMLVFSLILFLSAYSILIYFMSKTTFHELKEFIKRAINEREPLWAS